jgi:plastocyanin domain-containing protein
MRKLTGLIVALLALTAPAASFAAGHATQAQPAVVTLTTSYTSSKDIVPSSFEVKRGQKVRFVVDTKDSGSGCMSKIMIPGLWNSPVPLVKGKPVVMEFTPQKPGAYKITCDMGVARGVINVR